MRLTRPASSSLARAVMAALRVRSLDEGMLFGPRPEQLVMQQAIELSGACVGSERL
jgi:hypothetical protein